MIDEFSTMIEEAIRLELNVSDLYMLFYRQFHEDSHFWWKIAMEEQNHAALLKTVRQMNRYELQIPREILPSGLEDLIHSNKKILEAMDEFEKQPDRVRSFQFAYEIENSAGELHFDTYMKFGAESKLTTVFRKLNGEDIDHAERIRQYMTENHIPLEGNSNTGLGL